MSTGAREERRPGQGPQASSSSGSSPPARTCPRTLRSRCHRCCGAHGWRRFGDALELAQPHGALAQDLPDLILGEALEVGKALLHGSVKRA